MVLKRCKAFLQFLGVNRSRRVDDAPPARMSEADRALAKTLERRQEQLYFVHSMNRWSRGNSGPKPRVYLLSLSDYRTTISEKWTRISDRVAQVTRMIIQRNIGKVGLFAQTDDETFVMAMPSLDRHEAHRRVAKIASDLTNSLLGAQLVRGQRPVAITAQADLAALLTGEGMLDVKALRQVIAEARAIIASPSDPTAALADLVAGATRIAFGKNEAAAGSATDPVAADDPRARPIRSVNEWLEITAEKKTRREWECFRPDHRPATTALDLPEVPSLGEESNLSVVWRPCWVDSNATISAYASRIIRRDHEGGDLLEGSAAYPTGSNADVLALDRRTVSAAAQVLDYGKRDLGAITLILSLCFSSFHRSLRWSLTGPIADLPAAVRRDRLKIELFGLRPTVSEADLSDVVSYINSIGCETMVRFHPSAANLALLRKVKVGMIGLDLAELRSEDQMGDEDLLANLDRFREMAADRQMRAYLWGIRRRRLLIGSVLCGFNLVNGPGLMRDVGVPNHIVPVPRELLLASA
jgi:hypothetical protein